MADSNIKFGIDTAEAEKDVKALQREVEELDSLLSDGMQAKIDTAGAKDQLGELAGLAKTAFSFDAIGGAGDFLSDFAEQAKEARSSVLNFAAQTGASAEEVEAFRTQAEGLFRQGVGESLGEATKAIATAKQQLGGFLKGDDLQVFTSRAAAIGKVFDKDVNEVISKSRTFIAQFGLDGEKSGDLIALAMQKGGTAMDDVLDTTDEYSQLAKQAGFSAEEFVSTLVTGVQAGTRDTDKLADALKETQIRLKAGDVTKSLEDIKSPITATIGGIVAAGEKGELSVKEVLQKSAATIEEAFGAGKITEAVRSQLQVAISGTPAEDIGTEIYGKVFGAPIPVDQINEQAKAAGQQIQNALGPVTFLEKVGKEFDLLKTKTAELFAPVLAGAGEVLGTVSQIGPAISLLGSKENPLGALFSGLIGKVTALVPAFGALGTSGAAAGTATTAGFAPVLATILPIAAAVAAVVGVFVLAYKQSETFRNSIDGLVDKAGELWDTLVSNVEPILSDIGELIGEVAALIGELASVYLDLVIAQFEVFFSVISAIIGVIYDAGKGIADFVARLVGFSDIGDLLSKAFQGVKDIIGFLKNGVKEAKFAFEGFKAAIGSLGNTAGELWDKLTSFDIGGFFSTLIGGINDAAAEAQAKVRALRFQAIEDESAKKNLEQLTDPLDAIVKALQEGRYTADDAAAAVNRLQKSFETTWDGSSSIEPAKQLFDEYREKLKEAKSEAEKPVKIPPSKATVKVELVDFADVVQSATRTAENIRKQIQIDAINDERQRQIAAEEEKKRLALQAVDDREKDVSKKREEAIKKGSKVDEATYTAALAALKDQRVAIEEQTQAALRKIVATSLEKQFADMLSFQERAAADRLKLLQLQQEAAASALAAVLDPKEVSGALTGAFLTAFEAEEAVLRGQLQQELESRVQGEEAFKKERERIIKEGAAAVAAGTKTEQDVKLELEAQTAEVLKRRLADKSSIEYATAQATERKISELKKQYLQKQTDEAKKNLVERFGIEEALTEASLNLQKALYNAFFEAIDDSRKADLEKQLEANSKAADDLKEKIKNGTVDYYESNQERVRLLNERADIERQLSEQSFNLIKGINKAAAATFSNTQTKVAEEFDKTSKRFQEAYAAGKDTAALQTELLEQSAISFGLIIAESAVSGENILKASAGAFLDISLRLLEAESKAIIALIFGKSVAADPIFGALAAAALIATFSALSAIAKNALGITFAEGGYTGRGGKYQPAGVVHKGEFVHTQERTSEYWDAINAIHDGTFRRDWIRITDIQGLRLPQHHNSVTYVTPAGMLTGDSGLHRDISELRSVVASLHAATMAIPNQINVDVQSRQHTAVAATIDPRSLRKHNERITNIRLARA